MQEFSQRFNNHNTNTHMINTEGDRTGYATGATHNNLLMNSSVPVDLSVKPNKKEDPKI